MSADVLRRAAALMRERAEAATPGPWEHRKIYDTVYPVNRPEWAVVGEDCGCGGGVGLSEDAAHIASWHPVVALAVAGWLDAEAGAVEFDGGSRPDLLMPQALAVARAYLGEKS